MLIVVQVSIVSLPLDDSGTMRERERVSEFSSYPFPKQPAACLEADQVANQSVQLIMTHGHKIGTFGIRMHDPELQMSQHQLSFVATPKASENCAMPPQAA